MKHVLITGCTRGLGLAMARGFAARGWTVSGCGTNASAAAALGKELGPKHPITRCDVPQWTLLGVSLAGFNAIFSLAGEAFVLTLLRRRPTSAAR